ncbi:hypothetical protein [Leisingera sp. S232]|uniref:hypothetical protein n=1 Tax=Leisingera sp. S232 TaxID=3415132 RepID=UPI00086B582F|nr:hypothetical protein AB838_04690 [Rhodobacteraceae bacterium (ex Bugula neritina AB1)]
MLNHYIELLSLFRRKILKTALFSAGAALVLSLLLLKEMPIYESSVTMNMQPSQEDLRFNSAFLGVSQFNPATIIAQSHIERLLSRPVAGRAIDILVSQNDGNMPSDPPSVIGKLRKAVFRWLRILNSGYFVDLPEREQYISDLISASNIEIVEGSYILQASVSYTDPVIAAAAANALAQAYIEAAQEELSRDAARVDDALKAVQEDEEAKLALLLEERWSLEKQLGVSSLAAERSYRQDNRSAARHALEEANVVLLERESQLEALVAAIAREGDAGISRQLRQDLVKIRGALASARVRQAQRQDNLDAAEQALQDLGQAQEAFVAVDQRIADTRTELADLQERRIQTELARNAQLSQVRIISAAEPAVYPKFPMVMFNTVVGFIVGSLVMLVPIFASDVLGTRLRTSEDVRAIFGARSLPRLTPALLSAAKSVVKRDRAATPALRAFAEQVGHRLAVEGSGRWPTDTLYVTTQGASANANDLQLVMQAVVKILGRKNAQGEPLPVTALLPVSQISDWSALSRHHLVIGLASGGTNEAEVIGLAGGAQVSENGRSPSTFAMLLT